VIIQIFFGEMAIAKNLSKRINENNNLMSVCWLFKGLKQTQNLNFLDF